MTDFLNPPVRRTSWQEYAARRLAVLSGDRVILGDLIHLRSANSQIVVFENFG
jgi:hypothetical protein